MPRDTMPTDLRAVRAWVDCRAFGCARRLFLLCDTGRKLVTVFDFTTLRHQRMAQAALLRPDDVPLDCRGWRRLARAIETKDRQFRRQVPPLQHYNRKLALRVAKACRAAARES